MTRLDSCTPMRAIVVPSLLTLRVAVILTLLAAVVHADERKVAALPAWTLSDDENFRAEPDVKVLFQGKPSIRLKSLSDDDRRAVLAQWVDAEQYRGKRVRFSAQVKTASVWRETALWLRVDATTKGAEVLSPSMQSGSRDWRELSVVVAVPEDATQVLIGMSQIGEGSSWFNGFALSEVADDTPLAAVALDANGFREFSNGDFESGTALDDASPWFMVGRGRYQYRANLVEGEKHSGARSLKLTAFSNQSSYGALTQWISPKPYAGQRVRVRFWLKQLGVQRFGEAWVRVMDEHSYRSGLGAVGITQNLAINNEWHLVERVLDVPANALDLELGVGLLGAGDIWIDDVSIDVVDKKTPLSTPTLAESPDRMPFFLDRGLRQPYMSTSNFDRLSPRTNIAPTRSSGPHSSGPHIVGGRVVPGSGNGNGTGHTTGGAKR